MMEVKRVLKVGGFFILNFFVVDEFVEFVSFGDYGGLDIWYMNNGFWK